jgi:transposase
MSSLQVYNSRGNEYARIVEAYRDPVTKKPKTRILKNLGRVDVLETKEPGIIERLKRECVESKEMNQSLRQEALMRNIEKHMGGGGEEATRGYPVRNYGVKVYQKIWDELKLDNFFDYRKKKDSRIEYKIEDVISMLVMSRLMDAGSKKRSYEKKDHYITANEMGLEQVYRTLPFLAKEKKELEKHINKQLSQKMQRNLGVAFYDVTTCYFESVRADDLKKFGYSKDNKVNQVQVVMGLLIDEEGIPISYELFPGNTSDFTTLIPIMDDLKVRYGINKMILTADRGLNSGQNLAYLQQMGFDYVMGYKIRSASQVAREYILDESGYTQQGDGFKWKICNLDREAQYNGEKKALRDNLILTWSAKRAEKDRADRERLIEKSKRLVESGSALKAELKKGGKKYVQMTFIAEEQVSFNRKQVEKDEQLDGYYGIQTSDKNLTAEKAIEIYQGLWKIEESFRVLKTNFEARPIFVWTEESIQGHFVICYLALVIQRYLEYKLRKSSLNLSTERIQDALRSAKITVLPGLKNSGQDYYIKNESNEDYSSILAAQGIPEIPVYGLLGEILR